MTLGDILDGKEKDYYDTLAQVESSNNPYARPYRINKETGEKEYTSSALGLYQFLDGTWEEMVEEMGVEYTLDDRTNSEKSRKVAEYFTNKNKNYLEKKLGRDVNESELYLAHFAGMGGARKILEKLDENPNASINEVMGYDQIKANPQVFLNNGKAKKIYELYNWSAKKFGNELIKPEYDYFNDPEQIMKGQNEGTQVVDNSYNKKDIAYTQLPEVEKQKEEDPQTQQAQAPQQGSNQELYDAINSINIPIEPQQEVRPKKVEDLSYLYNYIKPLEV